MANDTVILVIISVLVLFLVFISIRRDDRPKRVIRRAIRNLDGITHNIPSKDTSDIKGTVNENDEEHFRWGPRRWFCPCGRWGNRLCRCGYRRYGYYL